MTIRYVDGFEAVGDFEVPTASMDPNHIALVNGKYYLGGIEIPAEMGSVLLEKSIKTGGSHTIFQPLRRN